MKRVLLFLSQGFEEYEASVFTDVKEYNLPSGKVLQTIFEYVLCRGKHYQCIGVTPDILIPQTENDIKQERDKQLEYAIDLLK
jgi:C-terminal processing protease CtpA/Prc